MTDIVTRRILADVRTLKRSYTFLVVGILLSIALQIVTLGFWVNYELRMAEIRDHLRKAAAEMQGVQRDLRHARDLMSHE